MLLLLEDATSRGTRMMPLDAELMSLLIFAPQYCFGVTGFEPEGKTVDIGRFSR
jgi:hypothetical protein